MHAFNLARFINEPSAELLREAKKNDWIGIFIKLILIVLREKLKLKRQLNYLASQGYLKGKEVLSLHESKGISDKELRLNEIELENAKLEDRRLEREEREMERKFQLELLERQSAAAMPSEHVLSFAIAKVNLYLLLINMIHRNFSSSLSKLQLVSHGQPNFGHY